MTFFYIFLGFVSDTCGSAIALSLVLVRDGPIRLIALFVILFLVIDFMFNLLN